MAFDRSQSELTKGDTLPVYAGLLQNYDGDVTKGFLLFVYTSTYLYIFYAFTVILSHSIFVYRLVLKSVSVNSSDKLNQLGLAAYIVT